MGVLLRVTDPVLDVMVRATGGRIGRGAALVVAILLLIAGRLALIPLLRA